MQQIYIPGQAEANIGKGESMIVLRYLATNSAADSNRENSRLKEVSNIQFTPIFLNKVTNFLWVYSECIGNYIYIWICSKTEEDGLEEVEGRRRR